ncbi:ribonuclease HII [Francisellaceae bacterium]|nr:ribonuclease HII [Francisellaceae bacterium]
MDINKNVIIAGVDEAGRGPLAGPVVAAAVVFGDDYIPEGLADSKKISEKKREKLFDEIISSAKSYAISIATVEEIDAINILQASLLAMKRSVDKLTTHFSMVLVDGNKLPIWDYPSEAIVKGDTKIKEISAASILAKVYRDRLMLEIDKHYPEYLFAQHKGYPTKQHLEKISQYGVLNVHRKSFKPIRELL